MKIAEVNAQVIAQGQQIEKLVTYVKAVMKVNEKQNAVIAELQGQIALLAQGHTAPAPAPACECDKITCEECLSRAMGQHNTQVAAIPAGTVNKPKAQAAKAQDDRPSKDTPFAELAVFLAGRVKHNRVNKTECHTEKLVGYNYGVTDFRFNLTRDERRLFKAARTAQDISAKDALVMLAGACERMGMK